MFSTDLPLGTILCSNKNDVAEWELRLRNGNKVFWNLQGVNWDSASGFYGKREIEALGWAVILPKESNVLRLLDKIDREG